MNRLIYSYFFLKFFLGEIFLLLFLTSTIQAINPQHDIDSVQQLLKHAKGIDKVNQFNRLTSLYYQKDTVMPFEYFKKAIVLAEHYGYNNQEYNAFNYLIGYYHGKAQYNRALIILKKARQFAERKNLKKAVGFANSFIGREYLLMNNYEEAYKYQRKGLQQFTHLDYKYGLALVYERMGLIFFVKNKFIDALKNFYMALNLNRKLHLQHETGISLYHIGLTKIDLSDYHEAVKYILQSLEIWDALNETANQWNSNELLGNIYIKMGDYQKALQYHRKALSIRQKNVRTGEKHGYKISVDSKLGLAYSYNNIAQVYLNLKNYDSAYYFAMKSYKLKTEKNNIASKNDIANSQDNLGNIYCALKKYDSAYFFLNKAVRTYRELNNKSSYATALYGLGDVNSALKKFIIAKNNYLNGLKMAKSVGDRYDVEKGYEYLSSIHKNA